MRLKRIFEVCFWLGIGKDLKREFSVILNVVTHEIEIIIDSEGNVWTKKRPHKGGQRKIINF